MSSNKKWTGHYLLLFGIAVAFIIFDQWSKGLVRQNIALGEEVYPIAFLGIWSTEQVLTVMVTNWGLKVLWEVVLTPVTYAVVGFLKRREGVDVFDEGTDFTPFRTRV